jgi:hypothetical protein
MSDIPQLERALVEAARRQARRTRRPHRWVIGGIVAAAAVALAALVIRAAGPDLERAAEPAPPAPTEDVGPILARVYETTEGDPSCEFVGTRGRLVAGGPSTATGAAFAVLRDPPQPGLGYRRTWLKAPLAGGEVLAGSVRPLHAPGGSPYLLVASRGPYAGHVRDPETCRAHQLALFDRLSQGLSPEDVRYAREGIVAAVRDGRGMGPDQEHLELYRLNPDGTRNGSWSEPVERARARGIYVTKVAGRGEFARTIAGIVPDGVAAVAIRWRDGDGEPSTTRADVRENFLYVRLPPGAKPEVTITWLDAAGRELRRIAYMAA